MIDLSNKLDTELETEKLNNLEKTLDNSINNEEEKTNEGGGSHNIFSSVATISNIDTESNKPENESSEVVNCLALTVKKDYSLSIVKNIALKTWKNFWRIAVSVFTLNFLKFFL